jgi:hypothetical protein
VDIGSLSIEAAGVRKLFEQSLERRRKMETLQDRYNIYVACMEGSTSYIKTFDEWLNS